MESDNYFQNNVYFQDYNMGNPTSLNSSNNSNNGSNNNSNNNNGNGGLSNSTSLMFLNKNLGNSDFQPFQLQPSLYLSSSSNNNNNNTNNNSNSNNTNNNSNNTNNNNNFEDVIFKKVSVNNLQTPTSPPKDMGFIQNILQQQQELFQKKLSDSGVTNLAPDQLQFMYMQEQQKYISSLNVNDIQLPPLDNGSGFQFQPVSSSILNSPINSNTNISSGSGNKQQQQQQQSPQQPISSPSVPQQQSPYNNQQQTVPPPTTSSLQQLQQQQMQQLMQMSPQHQQQHNQIQQQAYHQQQALQAQALQHQAQALQAQAQQQLAQQYQQQQAFQQAQQQAFQQAQQQQQQKSPVPNQPQQTQQSQPQQSQPQQSQQQYNQPPQQPQPSPQPQQYNQQPPQIQQLASQHAPPQKPTTPTPNSKSSKSTTITTTTVSSKKKPTKKQLQAQQAHAAQQQQAIQQQAQQAQAAQQQQLLQNNNDFNSEEDEFIDENSEDKSKSKSRSSQNIASRNYRQRKKDHISEVEYKVQQLSLENERLKQENHILKKGDLGDVMRPDFDFQQVLLESQKLMSQLQDAVTKQDHTTIENLLQLYYFASQLRTTVVEREVEKIVHPYTQARLAVMGYRSNAETSILLRPFSTTLWWPKYADEVGLTEEQRQASDILWTDHLKIDMELRTERDFLDREIKELFLKKIVSHGTRRPELLFERESLSTFNSEIDYPSSPSSNSGSGSSNSPPTSSPTMISPPGSPLQQLQAQHGGGHLNNNNAVHHSYHNHHHGHNIHNHGHTHNSSPYPVPSVVPTQNSLPSVLTEHNKPIELSELLDVTRKLEMLKKNFVKHRNLICDTDLVLSTILTPYQHAKLILRLNSVTCYDFSIVDTITGIWGSLNSSLKEGSFIQNLMPDQNGKFEVLEKFKQNQQSDIKGQKPVKLESLQKTYEKLYQTVLGSESPNCQFLKQADYQNQNLKTASPNYTNSPIITSQQQVQVQHQQQQIQQQQNIVPNNFDLSSNNKQQQQQQQQQAPSILAPSIISSGIESHQQQALHQQAQAQLQQQIQLQQMQQLQQAQQLQQQQAAQQQQMNQNASPSLPSTPTNNLDNSGGSNEGTPKKNKAKKFQWYNYKTPNV